MHTCVVLLQNSCLAPLASCLQLAEAHSAVHSILNAAVRLPAKGSGTARVVFGFYGADGWQARRCAGKALVGHLHSCAPRKEAISRLAAFVGRALSNLRALNVCSAGPLLPSAPWPAASLPPPPWPPRSPLSLLSWRQLSHTPSTLPRRRACCFKAWPRLSGRTTSARVDARRRWIDCCG
jgi:hypothetical protein